ncbi:Holliday junction branch migration DNA helicase RuvB [bacterium]|nr:Holliday junction branch migration DNA helicase RuvB [bacterium]
MGELLDAREKSEDNAATFEPKNFAEYLGQKNVKEKLELYVKAASMRNAPLDHLLLFGPPGLGKTTLARVITKELGATLKITSAPALERGGDLVAILSNLSERDVLFIDEIHRLPKIVEEILYSAMENFCVDMIVGQGAGAKSIRLPLEPFTLIGATTRTALLSGPLQTRFGIVERLDFYEADELADIAIQNAKFADVALEKDAALVIGSRARGTPRIAKRIVRRVQDFALVKGHANVSVPVVEEALQFLGIDEDGMNKLDRAILLHILRDFDGGPVGLETIAAVTGEDKDTIEDFCEPFLIRGGFLQKTVRGRKIPASKVLYLRRKLLGGDWATQASLFE